MSDRQPRPVRVFVIAPLLTRWGLEQLVTSHAPGLELAGVAQSVREGLRLLQCRPAHVILQADDGSSPEEVAQLCRADVGRVIVITKVHDSAVLDSFVLEGARGVVRVDDSPEALIKAIVKVHDGEIWVDRPAVARILLRMARSAMEQAAKDPEHAKIAALTIRERQTMMAIARHAGAPVKLLAHQLCISEHTVRNHLTSIYGKLGVANRTDLYAFLQRNGLGADGRPGDRA